MSTVSFIIDHASYGGYTNRGQHASGRGTINNYQFANPLEELEKRCSPSAAFDSAARFDPPRCAESTRLGIIQIIESWINTTRDTAVPSSLFWLYGGAGVGKSALAQSLSEEYQKKNDLAASFFFFRSDASRNNGDHLIPTLVSHLVDTFQGMASFVEERIRKNRALFTKGYENQIRELLIEPLLALKPEGALDTHSRLIVIDGLDECRNPEVQCELLRVIAGSILQIPYPLRILVTSRPEAHIADVFKHDPGLQAIEIHRYNLSDDPDADMDIRKFLEKEFEEIRRVHRLGQHLPRAWPGQNAITSLVERSSEHFIYASTVIRYIRSAKHRPDDRLEVILRLRPLQKGDRPYSQLDSLYALVFEGVGSQLQLEKICLVLGILYFQSESVGFMSHDGCSIEKLLGMRAGDLVLLLDPILSLIAMDGGAVRILHKSLFDYLLDFTRGGHLPFDLAQVHELAATYILKQKILRDLCSVKDFRVFASHCQYASLNDTLKDYLHSLEVPYSKSVVWIVPKPLPLEDELNQHLQAIIWAFFRTLSRKDFDSTGQVFELYVSKWMDYLSQWQKQSNITLYQLPELDKMLLEWTPQGFIPMETGLDPVRRAAFIKQEHSVFCAFGKASFSGNTNLIASSLVFGDYFIHSYNHWSRGKHSFLALRTYSRRSRHAGMTTLESLDRVMTLCHNHC